MRWALTGRKRSPIRLLGGAARDGEKLDVDSGLASDFLGATAGALLSALCGVHNVRFPSGKYESCRKWTVEWLGCYAPWLHLNPSPSGLVSFCYSLSF